MKKQEIDDVFDEHKEIYLFSKTSVRIQLNDTKGVKSQSENRKLDEETLVSRKVYLFHTDFSPISTLQVTWTRNVSQVTTVAAIRRSTEQTY